jgi:hypothetical protein
VTTCVMPVSIAMPIVTTIATAAELTVSFAA